MDLGGKLEKKVAAKEGRKVSLSWDCVGCCVWMAWEYAGRQNTPRWMTCRPEFDATERIFRQRRDRRRRMYS